MKKIYLKLLLGMAMLLPIGLAIHSKNINNDFKSNSTSTSSNPYLSDDTINALFQEQVNTTYDVDVDDAKTNVLNPDGTKLVIGSDDNGPIEIHFTNSKTLSNLNNSYWIAHPEVPHVNNTGYNVPFPQNVKALGETMAPGTHVTTTWFIIQQVYYQLNQIYYVYDSNTEGHALLFNWERTDPPANATKNNISHTIKPKINNQNNHSNSLGLSNANCYEYVPTHALRSGAGANNFMTEAIIPSATPNWNFMPVNIYSHPPYLNPTYNTRLLNYMKASINFIEKKNNDTDFFKDYLSWSQWNIKTKTILHGGLKNLILKSVDSYQDWGSINPNGNGGRTIVINFTYATKIDPNTLIKSSIKLAVDNNIFDADYQYYDTSSNPYWPNVQPSLNTLGPSFHNVQPNLNTIGPSFHNVQPSLNTLNPSFHNVLPNCTLLLNFLQTDFDNPFQNPQSTANKNDQAWRGWVDKNIPWTEWKNPIKLVFKSVDLSKCSTSTSSNGLINLNISFTYLDKTSPTSPNTLKKSSIQLFVTPSFLAGYLPF